jgi:enoyl-CoA hydratase
MGIDVAVGSEGVAEVAINLPPVNAFDSRRHAEMAEIFRGLGNNDSVRVVILRGEGKGFSAGIDLKELSANPGIIVAANRGAFAAYEAIHRCRVPVIAAVHGYALGGGVAMVGACDMILAAEGARFGLPEIDRGLLGGASHMLRMLPMQIVRRAYYTGEPVMAEEAYRLGALEAVHPIDSLLPAARDLARKIAGKSPVAIRLAKEALNGIEPVDLELNYRYEQGFTFEISHLAEANEARQAFIAKRDTTSATDRGASGAGG